MSRRLRPTLLILISSTLACDSKPPSGPTPVHPVKGQVTYQGKPVANALVIFHRDGGAPQADQPGPDGAPRSQIPVPTGKTDFEGRFQIQTYVNNDGAPTGGYKVTVVLAGSSEKRDFLAKTSAPTSNITLPAKYADPAQSGLIATVKAGDNILPPYEL